MVQDHSRRVAERRHAGRDGGGAKVVVQVGADEHAVAPPTLGEELVRPRDHLGGGTCAVRSHDPILQCRERMARRVEQQVVAIAHLAAAASRQLAHRLGIVEVAGLENVGEVDMRRTLAARAPTSQGRGTLGVATNVVGRRPATRLIRDAQQLVAREERGVRSARRAGTDVERAQPTLRLRRAGVLDSSAMKPHMPLGDFLVAYLRKVGVTHLFGIPGDLVMRLFLRFGRKHGLKIVTFSHEPGVGFAADGYARATGRLGVVCVTYGAGGLNMVNPVAGSFSERVPILVVSGGPGEEERKLGTLIHHQAKEIESQLHIYRELTCEARVVDNPATAAADIDAVVREIWAERRPGYLEIHRDMVESRSRCRAPFSTGTETCRSAAPTRARFAKRRARRRRD